MKNYVLEKAMTNSVDGYYLVVIEGETHLNRTIIKSNIQFFANEGGYNYNHPEKDAQQNAQAIANGLNELEKLKVEQNTRYPNYELDSGGWKIGDKFTTPETGDSVFTVCEVHKNDVEARDARSRAGYSIFAKHWITKIK